MHFGDNIPICGDGCCKDDGLILYFYSREGMENDDIGFYSDPTRREVIKLIEMFEGLGYEVDSSNIKRKFGL